jgi:hypothetical protein
LIRPSVVRRRGRSGSRRGRSSSSRGQPPPSGGGRQLGGREPSPASGSRTTSGAPGPLRAQCAPGPERRSVRETGPAGGVRSGAVCRSGLVFRSTSDGDAGVADPESRRDGSPRRRPFQLGETVWEVRGGPGSRAAGLGLMARCGWAPLFCPDQRLVKRWDVGWVMPAVAGGPGTPRMQAVTRSARGASSGRLAKASATVVAGRGWRRRVGVISVRKM